MRLSNGKILNLSIKLPLLFCALQIRVLLNSQRNKKTQIWTEHLISESTLSPWIFQCYDYIDQKLLITYLLKLSLLVFVPIPSQSCFWTVQSVSLVYFYRKRRKTSIPFLHPNPTYFPTAGILILAATLQHRGWHSRTNRSNWIWLDLSPQQQFKIWFKIICTSV